MIAERAGSRLVSAAGMFDALGSALRRITELGGDGPVDADIYLAWEQQPDNGDATAAALHEVIGEYGPPGQVRRLVVTVAGSHGAVMHHHFTFRASGTGLAEDRQGRIYAVDYAYRVIERFRPDGQIDAVWSVPVDQAETD